MNVLFLHHTLVSNATSSLSGSKKGKEGRKGKGRRCMKYNNELVIHSHARLQWRPCALFRPTYGVIAINIIQYVPHEMDQSLFYSLKAILTVVTLSIFS